MPVQHHNKNNDNWSDMNAALPSGMLLPLLLTVFVVLVAFKNFILGDYVYCFSGIGSDSVNALYPYIVNAYDACHKNGLPGWSFDYGMGQNIFAFCLRDPFDVLLLFLKRTDIIYGLAYLEIIKILLTAIVFYRYLTLLGCANLIKATGVLLFCFCSYNMIGGVWHFFSFEVLNLALLLLAVELQIQKNRGFWLSIPVFFIGVTMPLNLYFFGVFFVFYLSVRFVVLNRLQRKTAIPQVLKIIGWGCTGLLLSLPFLVENIAQIMESPRVGGINGFSRLLGNMKPWTPAPAAMLATTALRLFSNDMTGNAASFRGWGNYFEAPMLYAGLPCLVLLPQAFIFINRKMKIIIGIFLAVWLLPLLLPYFRLAFWLFSGNYFRIYSFFISLILLSGGLFALQQILTLRRINVPLLVATVGALILLLFLPFAHTANIVDVQLRRLCTFLIVIYACISYLLSRPSNDRLTQYLFLLIVFLETLYFTDNTLNGWAALPASVVGGKNGYGDATIAAVAFLKKTDSSFFRIDKYYYSSPSEHYSFNDGLMQQYKGTSEYGSFNQLGYVQYLQLTGVVDGTKEKESRWIKGLNNYPILEAENRVKYFLYKPEAIPSVRVRGVPIARFDDVVVCRNPEVLPFGYTYSRYITEEEYKNCSTAAKLLLTAKTAVVTGADLQQLQGVQHISLTDSTATAELARAAASSSFSELCADTLTGVTFSDRSVSGKINVGSNKILYLPIPFDNGWTLRTDGHIQMKLRLFGGMTGVYLPKGKHTILLTFNLRLNKFLFGV
jgi:Bacterial membrane protein YfhO